MKPIYKHSFFAIFSAVPLLGACADVPGEDVASASQEILPPSFTGPVTATNNVNTLGFGVGTQLTAHAQFVAGKYIYICDETTATMIAYAYAVATYTTPQWISYSSQTTTHKYAAYVTQTFQSNYNAVKANALATSPATYVTWTNITNPQGVIYQVSLPSSSLCNVGQNVSVTATVNADLARTPYYVSIYDDQGTRLNPSGSCGAGNTCTVSFLCRNTNLVAFVAIAESPVPPTNTVASSLTDAVQISSGIIN